MRFGRTDVARLAQTQDANTKRDSAFNAGTKPISGPEVGFSLPLTKLLQPSVLSLGSHQLQGASLALCRPAC